MAAPTLAAEEPNALEDMLARDSELTLHLRSYYFDRHKPTSEYDMTVDWRFTAPQWPAWTKPLWVRLRAAYVDQGSAGNTTDYRVIINYPWHLR
jgi:hypothetical protein